MPDYGFLKKKGAEICRIVTLSDVLPTLSWLTNILSTEPALFIFRKETYSTLGKLPLLKGAKGRSGAISGITIEIRVVQIGTIVCNI